MTITVTPAEWTTTGTTEGITCNGPRDGQRVRFRRKDKDEAIDAIVAIHWHYDGCVLDVEATDECGTTVR